MSQLISGGVRFGGRQLARITPGQAFNINTGEPIGAPGIGLLEALRLRGQQRQRQEQAFTAATGVDPNAPSIPQNFEQAFALANARNEERFQQGLRLFDQMQANAAQLGQTRREQIRREDIRQEGLDVESLISRGLFSSTGLETLQRARAEDRRFQETALDEALLRERNRITGERIGFIERRTDAAPDPALFANLQRSASAAPGGGIGGISGIGGIGGGGVSIRTIGGGSSFNNPAATRLDESTFGRLVRRNPSADQGPGRSSQRSQALSNFRDRGVDFGGLSNSQIDALLRSLGITISTARQVNNLPRASIDRIRNAVRDFNRGANR